MFKNYLIIAKRILLNKPFFTLLNIFGLAIGIAASALIFHYISFEESFDEYHPNKENIYRLTYGRTSSDGSDVEFASACPVIAPLLKENFKEVKKIARLAVREATFAYDEKKFIENKIYYAEQKILNILHFELINGSYKNALTQPNNILICESAAKRYFGNSNPVGKTLRLNKKEDFQIVGVYRDMPSNTHLKPEFLIGWPSMKTYRGIEYLESWGHTGAFTYLILNPDANPRELEKQFIKYTESQIGEMLTRYNIVMYFNLQSIEEIHLKSNLLQEQEVNGDKKSVNFLYIIGIFILVIAWVNYINLTTSRALERAKEVGMRKVIGASKRNLIKQFYTEASIINLTGLYIALILVELFKPLFSNITGIPNEYRTWDQTWFLFYIVGTFIIGTFITGMYPVFVLSSFKPVQVLKSKLISKTKGFNLRRMLVVVQIIFSIILLTGTFAVFQQIKYMQSQDVGFTMDQTLVVRLPKAIDSTYVGRKDIFMDEVRSISKVNGVAFSTEVPGRKIYWDNGGIFKVGKDQSSGKNYMIMGVDDEFIDLYDMQFIMGRNFSKEYPSDKNAVIINETAVKWLEFDNPDDALNKQINYWGNIYTIIGVLKDYRHESPKAHTEPQIFRYLPNENRFGTFSIKIEEGDIKKTVKQVESIWNNQFTGNPFDYFFLDVYYDEQFKSDRKFGKVFGIFSFLAIFITCLGLFGLSLYNANLRTKEIGIRKVLGANIIDVLFNILKEYIYLIVISVVVSVPLLIWGVKLWLNDFSLHMNITAWLFIFPVIIVFLITILSVSSQTLKVALRNPVESLRYE